MTIEPLVRLHAIYVPDSEWTGTPRWLPMFNGDTAPGGGPNWYGTENNPSWESEFQTALMNGWIAWWPAGGYYMDGTAQAFSGQYCVAPFVDSDSDGMPDGVDPYPSDPNNNTYYWPGGWWNVNNGSQNFEGRYYATSSFLDSDWDGMPDDVDPYPSDPNNGNSPTYQWGGVSYTINNTAVYFEMQTFTGSWSDSDGDGIPDPADPYPYDSNNGNSTPPETFYWSGGSYVVNGASVSYDAGTYAGNSYDGDSDGIPDVLDPYITDANNNSAWWGGGSFMVDAQNVSATGQWHRADAGDVDTDGMPDDLDPYPSDPTNNTAYWAGGTYVISGVETEFYPQYYPGPAQDEDQDGIPDYLDPFLQNFTNNTSWWNGGTFLLNGEYSDFPAQYYAGLPTDTDADGIPDALDPYANDPWNGTSFYWEGGAFTIDGGYAYFQAAQYGGFRVDRDGDNIPDVADPYPDDASNNTAWWSGGTFTLGGIYVSYDGQYMRADLLVDNDGDGLPNSMDPYPDDSNNSSYWWDGGYFWVNNTTLHYQGQYASAPFGPDTDQDGMPDNVDPYPNSTVNGSNKVAFFWEGGYLADATGNWNYYEARFYEGTWTDYDHDNIPDVANPYANYWAGASSCVDNAIVQFPGGNLTNFTDTDWDGIPDLVDPYPYDTRNNSTVWMPRPGDRDGDNYPDMTDPFPDDPWNDVHFIWPAEGTTFDVAEPPMVFYSARYAGNWADVDGDGIPDQADPAPTDYFNGSYFDHDGDGIPSRVEAQYGMNWWDPADGRAVRADGLSNAQAYQAGLPLTGPMMDLNLDSDSDSMTDVYEIQNHLNRFDKLDSVAAPLGDLVFNLEKAARHLPVGTEVVADSQYLLLTGHSRDGLTIDPNKSVAENDWDNDGVSNVDELLLFHTDPRDSESAPTYAAIKLAMLEGRLSLTTRANFLWAVDPGSANGGDTPSGNPGAASPNEVDTIDPMPPAPPPPPSCECAGVGHGCNCYGPDACDGSGDQCKRCICSGPACVCVTEVGCDGTGNQCQPPPVIPPCDCMCQQVGCECNGMPLETCVPPEPAPICECGCEKRGCGCGYAKDLKCGCGCGKDCCTCGGSGGCKEPDNRNYALPTEDSSGAKYRKIALNGRPMADEKPQQSEESDQQKEETFVDAMTLGLRHSVTDIHVPIPGSDLSLSARRNVASTIWSLQSGLRPHERRDRPFGSGWTSSLAPTVEFVSAPDTPLTVLVTDDQGTTHRFAHWRIGLQNYYAPWPTSFAETSDHLTKFEGNENGGTFTSRYGTKIVFVPSGKSYFLSADRMQGSSNWEVHQYLRASTVTDRLGKTVQYSYSGNTIIPDTIAPVGSPTQAISIRHNALGLVTGIWEPNGNKTEFTYGNLRYYYFGIPFDAPVLTQVRAADGAVTRYGYEIVFDPQADASSTHHFHLDLTAIFDPLGRAFRFKYAFDRSRLDIKNGAYVTQTGMSRNITEVMLPDTNHATFVNQSNMSLEFDPFVGLQLQPGCQRQTTVTDAAGNQTVYSWPRSFSKVLETKSMNDVLSSWDKIPKIVFFNKMVVNYGGMGTEEYIFDPQAGMNVTWAKDLSGNVTEYLYEDTWAAPAPYRKIFPYFQGMNGKYPDPTQESRMLVGAKKFKYSSEWRIMSESEDEEHRVTVNDVDAKGRRTKTTVKMKNGLDEQVTEFTYGDTDFPGVVTRQTVKRGSGDPAWAQDLVTKFELDENGRVKKQIVDPDGPQPLITESEYDVNGNKLWTKDANNHVTSFSYDRGNRLVGVQYPENGATTLIYNAAGNKISEIVENGAADQETKFTYDAMDRLIEQRRVMNAGPNSDLVTTFEYNQVGAKTRVVDPRGNAIVTTYDTLLRPISATDPEGGETTFEYGLNSGGRAFDSSGFKPTKVTDAANHSTTTTYDSLYRPISVAVNYGDGLAITNTEYDAVGNPIKETDPLGRVTSKFYDPLNRLIEVQFPRDPGLAIPKNRFSYTGTGLKWKAVDELNRETETEYDRTGRAVKVFSPPALPGGTRPMTETVYDKVGNIVAVINGLGQRIDSSYDARNRKVRDQGPAVLDGLSGNTTRPTTDTVYDLVGNVVSVIDPRGGVSTTEYDVANRKVKSWAPVVAYVNEAGESVQGRPMTQMAYDKAGNVLQLTDPRGHTTTNTYDKMNRLRTTTDEEGMMVENRYDKVGNRTSIIDGKGNETKFTYDGLKRNRTIKSVPLNVTTTFKYNGVNKYERIDADGQETTYAYDARNRLKTVGYLNRPADNRFYDYDLAGRLLLVSEPDPSKAGKADVAYTYDALDRVLTETSGGVTHQYAYDLGGNRLSAVYGGTSRALVSTYDALNRSATITETAPGDEGARVTRYHYDLSGNIVRKVLPNGDRVDTAYDAMNRAKTISGYASDGVSLYQYSQEWDGAGNVIGIVEGTDPAHSAPSGAQRTAPRIVAMTYDKVNRLKSETETVNPGPSAQVTLTEYAYDLANNRTKRTKAGIHTTYQYDGGNRLKSFTENSARTVAYGYNNAGSRTSRIEGTGPEAIEDIYSYDGEQRLVTLTKIDQTYIYLYDYRARRVERVEGTTETKVIFSGGTSVSETIGGSTAVEYVRGSDWGGGVGGILYTKRLAGFSFTHYDSRGDVTSKTDDSGSVTYQASYEAFGTRTQEQGFTNDRQKANTKEEDPTGLLNEGMRYRDLETGAFITADPAGFVDGPNVYAYVVQNPWTKFDPEGLESKHEKKWKEIASDDNTNMAMRFVAMGMSAVESLNPFRSDSSVRGAGRDMQKGFAESGEILKRDAPPGIREVSQFTMGVASAGTVVVSGPAGVGELRDSVQQRGVVATGKQMVVGLAEHAVNNPVQFAGELVAGAAAGKGLTPVRPSTGRIFYVGEGAEALARSTAAQTGYKTIYNTWYGKIGEKLTPYLSKSRSRAMWDVLSKWFANGAKQGDDVITVFGRHAKTGRHEMSIDSKSAWRRVEYPTLEANGIPYRPILTD